jgi:hypothetical protein
VTRQPAKGWHTDGGGRWALDVPGATCTVEEWGDGFCYSVTGANMDARGLSDGSRDQAMVTAEDAAAVLLREGVARLTVNEGAKP